MSEDKISDETLYLKDWEVTKDRIKHFDDIVMKIRLQAIPISTAFFVAGWTLNSQGVKWSYFIFLFAALYIIPIALLDWFHYHLLIRSVNHAIDIENNKFDNKIQITNKLTTDTLTWVHNCAAALVYIFVFISAIISFCITKGVLIIE